MGISPCLGGSAFGVTLLTNIVQGQVTKRKVDSYRPSVHQTNRWLEGRPFRKPMEFIALSAHSFARPSGASYSIQRWTRQTPRVFGARAGRGCQHRFGIPFWLGLVNSPPILGFLFLVVGLNRMFTGGSIWVLTNSQMCGGADLRTSFGFALGDSSIMCAHLEQAALARCL